MSIMFCVVEGKSQSQLFVFESCDLFSVLEQNKWHFSKTAAQKHLLHKVKGLRRQGWSKSIVQEKVPLHINFKLDFEVRNQNPFSLIIF